MSIARTIEAASKRLEEKSDRSKNEFIDFQDGRPVVCERITLSDASGVIQVLKPKEEPKK